MQKQSKKSGGQDKNETTQNKTDSYLFTGHALVQGILCGLLSDHSRIFCGSVSAGSGQGGIHLFPLSWNDAVPSADADGEICNGGTFYLCGDPDVGVGEQALHRHSGCGGRRSGDCGAFGVWRRVQLDE